MGGQIIKEVHKCELPKVLKRYNKGTVWLCDCGNLFEIIDIFGEMTWQPQAECRRLEAIRAQTNWQRYGKEDLQIALTVLTIVGLVMTLIFWFIF